MRALGSLALAVVVTACGSGPRTAPADPHTRTLALIDAGQGGKFDIELVREETRWTGRVDGSPEAVWKHLPAVYEELGIGSRDLSIFNTVGHQIGVNNRRMSRLGDRRMSEILDCGPSLLSDKADRGQTRVSLTTWLEAREDGTAVHTRLQATSRDGGTSATPALCTSRGVLEREIMNRLLLRLALDR